MKKTITILAMTLLSINTFAQAPNWQWAKSAGGSYYDYGVGIVEDGAGNSYVTGNFGSPSITFGSTTLTNADNTGNTSDMYIVKYDAGGNVVWAKGAGGSSLDYGIGIAVDASGNSYVTGEFQSSSITFGSTTLTNTHAGWYDIFIVKYDASGNVVWAKSAGGTGDDAGNSIAVDASGNTYVTGYFLSSSITFGSTTLTNSGGMFIAKYDASGNVVWAISAGSYAVGNGIAVDATGNSYVTGYFGGSSITFGSITLTNAGGNNNPTDMFIVKYDASGAVVWANRAGGSSPDMGNGIALDGSGNSYVTGYFQSSTITFGSTTLTNADNTGYTYDMFIVKYDASGAVVWANRAGGSYRDYGTGITVDASGNSYITGDFYSPSISFGSITLSNLNIYGNNVDMFIVKYDTGGNAIWAKATGNYGVEGSGIAVNGRGNLYVTGDFNNLSITIGSTTLNLAGQYDMFIAKIDSTQMTVGINEITSEENEINIYPNPFTSQTTISFNELQKNTTIKIMDVVGKEIKTVLFSGKSLILEKGEMQSGVYFVQITVDSASSPTYKNVVNKKVVVE